MSRSRRVSLATALGALGLLAFLFLHGRIVSCLGPLFVTKVQCAKVTGVVPEVGLGLPILAVCLAAASLVILPLSVDRRAPALVGGIVGGLTGAVLFAIFRPLTMEGSDSGGQWISIVRPFDPSALATASVLGALIGVVVGLLLRVVVRWGRT